DRRVTPWAELLDLLKAKLFNLQSFSRASQANTRHYNIGNKLYRLMLGERLIYSCAYWKNAATLDEAQEAKVTSLTLPNHCKSVSAAHPSLRWLRRGSFLITSLWRSIAP
ncbi:MAG: class I SAM-dependent methyltransferase, partial [Gammaproteobacteria bacterium]